MYTASNPNNMSSGASIQSVLSAMDTNIQPILDRHNLGTIDPDEWYSHVDYLNVFNDLVAEDNNVMFELVNIGMKILDNAIFPPNVDSVETALGSLNAYYKLNNKDDDGGWDVQIDGQTAICTSTTPFPPDLEYGILYAMVRRFVKRGERAIVEYQDLSMRTGTKGVHAPCVYKVSWG